ncbi:hypothetical protein chiPu_0007145 [Chiloscyllium punctatum]|uniref:Uncharacterized protein n=1 Tax=Chiloscyllium punctatum TaxID=137246 RepID=A0A401SEA4_CHIPU|nr:hypothetical protein [Chiloscyllium punctatum]
MLQSLFEVTFRAGSAQTSRAGPEQRNALSFWRVTPADWWATETDSSSREGCPLSQDGADRPISTKSSYMTREGEQKATSSRTDFIKLEQTPPDPCVFSAPVSLLLTTSILYNGLLQAAHYSPEQHMMLA